MAAMVFVDGENLLTRFEAMLAAGRTPAPALLIHSRGEYVWTEQVTAPRKLEIVRVSYYTSQVGDDSALRKLEAKICKLPWRSNMPRSNGTINPHVFKKSSKSQKTASVDINITIDVLRHCYQRNIDAAVIISGDGDYIPLIKEAMRTGTRVVVGALSSGLNPELPLVCDEFWNLDPTLLQP